MRASQFHLFTLKEAPSDAEIVSQKLMLRAGMIRKAAAGIYTYQPLGLRSLRKVENIVREEMNRAGAIELTMPMVQPAELWQETGRWDKMGEELLLSSTRVLPARLAASGYEFRFPQLEGALQHRACRDGDDIVVAIGNVGAGHNVPTGDVHRHLVARLWRPSAPESLFEIFIGRRFEPDDHGGKRTTWDSTIPPQTTRRYRTRLAGLGGDADEPVSFELRYVYTADEIPRRTRDPGKPCGPGR